MNEKITYTVYKRTGSRLVNTDRMNRLRGDYYHREPYVEYYIETSEGKSFIKDQGMYSKWKKRRKSQGHIIILSK